MNSILGILLLFFIQRFFLSLGINATLSKEDRIIKDNRSLLLKWSGFWIWRLMGRTIYKVIIFIVYLSFFCNILCSCICEFYETNIIQGILERSIKTSFSLIPFLIILNFIQGKKSNKVFPFLPQIQIDGRKMKKNIKYDIIAFSRGK